MQKIKSQRNKEIILKDGFIYNMDRQFGDKMRWRCRVTGCRAFLLVNRSNIIKEEYQHTHEPDHAKCSKLAYLHEIKSRAADTMERPVDIISNNIKEITEQVAAEMPEMDSMKKTIRRVRNEIVGAASVYFYDLPAELIRDDQGNLFLKKDTGHQNPDRIIIFSNEFKSKYIEKCEFILIDGTFKSCPVGFSQVLVIHGIILGSSYPLFYCLLKSKREQTYVKCLEFCNDFIVFNPLYIISDLEKSLVNAISTVFKYSTLKLCYFHFTQAIHKYYKSIIPNDTRNANPVLNKFINSCISLALVPKDFVRPVYDVLKQDLDAESHQKLLPFLEYFEKVYIGTNINGCERTPSYDLEKWNHFDSILLKNPRTTNFAERWNRTFNELTSIKHPNIAHFISCLKKEENLDHFHIQRALCGVFKFKSRTLTYEEELFVLARNKKYFTPMNYLLAVLEIRKRKYLPDISLENN